jgi:amidohydrolase
VRRAEEIVAGICQAMRTTYDFDARLCCPPVVNDPGMTDLVQTVATRLFGAERVVTVDQSTVGDDVAFFNLKAPGCHIMVGSGNPARGLDKPHHHPQFDFDEAALPIAAELLAACALEFLQGK